jgi:hypothetical protein
MASLNVFQQDLFSTVSLTEAVEKVPFNPIGIGSLGLFTPQPIRTQNLAVESRQGKLYLVPFSERGEAGKQRTTEKRQGFFFKVPRLMTSDTIRASELQDIRAFGSETELMQIEAEVSRRIAGPTGLLANLEYTKEFLRLAAVQGYVTDPGTGQTLYDLYAQFGLTRPAAFSLGLATPVANTLRTAINQNILRPMARAAQGGMPQGTRVVGLCGDTFYDELCSHPDVIRTFVNWSDARELRADVGGAFSTFPFGGVDWVNYRGSDDNATIKIPNNSCALFPNAPALFSVAYAPGESMEWVNTLGKEQYILPIPDRDRNMFWTMEAYSYPMFYCLRPEVLYSATV